MTKLDPRICAYREDLADISLKGSVTAKKYVTPETYHIISPSPYLKKEPRDNAQIVSQALCGEEVNVFEIKNGWVWGQLLKDDYVGYLQLADLAQGRFEPTGKVIVKHTHIYPEPDIKTHPTGFYNLGALLSGEKFNKTFFETSLGGYVIRAHIAHIDIIETDYVSVAETFIGDPYLWGGKTSFGIDCSGLVQVSLQAVGLDSPRDSDMQAEILGHPLPKTKWGDLKRGDLVFWKGHVGIMTDTRSLLHANGHHMLVVKESFDLARKRIAADYGDITQINRF